jgi:16S rRNA (adenine1518-N6/adenine1519-N6)-dimethyltransferase
VSGQTRSEVRALLQRHGLNPRKSLGQHFLADPNITTKIVATAGVGSDDRVIEIGPGTGTLTTALAATGASVLAIEIDETLEPVLSEVTAGYPDVTVRYVDATDLDLGAELTGGEWVMVANLPYNVGTPLVLDALRHVPQISRFVVMIQVEVARRFAATPGSKEYGVPSVVCQIHADTTMSFTVPPQVFVPPPRVGSAVVVLRRHSAPQGAERAIRLAAAAFGQRRKMIRRSLVGIMPHVDELARRVGIDPQMRAEQLTPDDFLRLAEVWDG